MIDYLSKTIKFDNISLSQIKSLLRIVLTSSKNDLQYIERKFDTASLNFEDTLSFLLQIKLLKLASGWLKSSINSDEFNDEERLKYRLLKAISRKGFYKRSGIKDYTNKFKIKEGLWEYAPKAHERVATSGIRNFLIELGVIVYDESRSVYSITNSSLKFLQTQANKKISYKSFSKKLADIEKLGLEAEKIILLHEKRLLKNYPQIANQIEHTSQLNVRAGYDVKSFIVAKGKIKEEKYIEVKAVSLKDYKFYWSINEIESAKTHNKKYYLYLLPVISRNQFELKQLLIINSPYKKVFLTHQWNKKSELFCLSKKIK